MRWHRGSALSDETTTVDALAQTAIAEIKTGMTVGLGAGRTAARGIAALAEKVKNEGLEITCCAASEAAEQLAKELGLAPCEFALTEEIDILIDGADEVDRSMRVMKGSRGAVTRERMLAWASRKTIFMVDADKVTERIGTRSTLAIAVMAFGLASTRAAIRRIGLNGVIRRDLDGAFFLTDNGNLILDVTLDGDESLDALNTSLNDLPGVVDHGLFLTEADVILIERAGDRGIEKLDRESVNAES